MCNILFLINLVSQIGVVVNLETNYFEDNRTIKVETKIMKLGDKIRIESTLPNSKEIGEIIISDSKEGWHFVVDCKPAKIKPIKNPMDMFIPKENIKGVVIDKSTKLPIKKEIGKEITYYKDYKIIENFGALPAIIEKYTDGKLDSQTKIISVNEKVEINNEMFSFKNVKFTEKAKKEAEKLIPR